MTPQEIEAKYQALQNEVVGMADVSFGNYKQELKEYRRILVEMLGLGIEGTKTLAGNALKPPTAS